MNNSIHNAVKRSHNVLSDGARQLSDQVLQSAGDAVDITRNFSNDTLDMADRKVRNVRDRLTPAIDELSVSAQRLAKRGAELAAETAARAQRSFSQYAGATERYVAEQPVKAVLIAAVAGAVLAALAMSSRKRRDSTH